MLDKLKRYLAGGSDRPVISPDPQPGTTSVTFDHRTIRLHQPDGRAGSIDWDDLGSVTVAVTEGDVSDDVFWLLLSRDRARFLTVPLCAVGEREFFLAMQLRLTSFDNDAVIRAMTSLETEHFTVWQAPELSAGRGTTLN